MYRQSEPMSLGYLSYNLPLLKAKYLKTYFQTGFLAIPQTECITNDFSARCTTRMWRSIRCTFPDRVSADLSEYRVILCANSACAG
jgi:hypothetical protein